LTKYQIATECAWVPSSSLVAQLPAFKAHVRPSEEIHLPVTSALTHDSTMKIGEHVMCWQMQLIKTVAAFLHDRRMHSCGATAAASQPLWR
jgi:hypothetical protein